MIAISTAAPEGCKTDFTLIKNGNETMFNYDCVIGSDSGYMICYFSCTGCSASAQCPYENIITMTCKK
jgi:hypothetical protein